MAQSIEIDPESLLVVTYQNLISVEMDDEQIVPGEVFLYNFMTLSEKNYKAVLIHIKKILIKNVNENGEVVEKEYPVKQFCLTYQESIKICAINYFAELKLRKRDPEKDEKISPPSLKKIYQEYSACSERFKLPKILYADLSDHLDTLGFTATEVQKKHRREPYYDNCIIINDADAGIY